MADSSDDTGNAFQEWTSARSLIMWYEDKIHDLRKYGFSLVAALLSTTAITAMLKMDQSASAILIILTCVLLIAVYLFDRNYRFYQKAAAGRVKILEPILNIKLSEVLADWYYTQQMFNIVPALYVIFIWITCSLGFFVASEYWPAIAIIGVITTLIIGILFLVVDQNLGEKAGKSYKKIILDKKIQPDNKSGESYTGDWSVDRITCECGGSIRFTLTNTGGSVRNDNEGKKISSSNSISFHKDDAVLYLSDNLTAPIYIKAESEVQIPRNFNYSWFWTPEKVHENKLFTIYPSNLRRLKRTIFIKKSKDASKTEPNKIELSGHIRMEGNTQDISLK